MGKKRPKMLDDEFPVRIQDARQHKRLSQAALGEMVGVSGAAVSEWERGVTEPEASRHQRIAQALDTTIENLFRIDIYGRLLVEQKSEKFTTSREPDSMNDAWKIIAKIQSELSDMKQEIFELHNEIDRLKAAYRPRGARKT